jgi:hypothetical protein
MEPAAETPIQTGTVWLRLGPYYAAMLQTSRPL